VDGTESGKVVDRDPRNTRRGHVDVREAKRRCGKNGRRTRLGNFS
jgi:hypothetical protein